MDGYKDDTGELYTLWGGGFALHRDMFREVDWGTAIDKAYRHCTYGDDQVRTHT
jgi:hypothetical protein